MITCERSAAEAKNSLPVTGLLVLASRYGAAPFPIRGDYPPLPPPLA